MDMNLLSAILSTLSAATLGVVLVILLLSIIY